MQLICLHTVTPGPVDAFDAKCSRISRAEFEAFLEAVAARFELMSYSDYTAALAAGRADAEAVALSFDDGFVGVYEEALPVLAARGLDAVAFINPPFLGNPPGRIFHFLELEIAFRLTDAEALDFDGDTLALSDETARIAAMKRVKKRLKTWPEDRRSAAHGAVLSALGVPEEAILAYAADAGRMQVMSEAMLRALAGAGWTIGSHGQHHLTLSMQPPDALRHEIEDAAAAFAARFGWHAMPFAYPYGDRVHVGDAAPAAVAAAGHPMAFTTVPGASDLAQAPHLLPRIDYKRFLRDHAIRLDA